MNEQVTISVQPGTHTVPLSLVDLGKRLLDASKRGDSLEIRSLMSSGAPFTTDWLGTSPLHFAAMHGHVDTVSILLRAGISRDARTKVDRTPLHVAAQAGHFEIVQTLLKNGAIVDACDMLKMTPLHWAVENGHVNIVNLLLKFDADTSIIDKFDRTPMEIALANMQMDIVQLLQSHHSTKAQNRTVTNHEAMIEEEVITTTDQRSDNAAVIITNELEISDGSQDAIETRSDVSNKKIGQKTGNTSVLAALAELAEATSNTSNSSNDTASWLSSRGLTIANMESSTPFTLTEAGKLALTKYIEQQGMAAEGTVMTLVDEDGNPVLLVQQDSGNVPVDSEEMLNEEIQETTDLHIDTTKHVQEELIEETVD